MTREFDYIVYLCGSSNSANKPMSNDAEPVGIVTAPNQLIAIEMAMTEMSVYNGQYLRAVPASRCSKDDCIAASEADWAREYLREVNRP